jgi:hypothetical protein
MRRFTAIGSYWVSDDTGKPRIKDGAAYEVPFMFTLSASNPVDAVQSILEPFGHSQAVHFHGATLTVLLEGEAPAMVTRSAFLVSLGHLDAVGLLALDLDVVGHPFADAGSVANYSFRLLLAF